jgi:hypothetical protein
MANDLLGLSIGGGSLGLKMAGKGAKKKAGKLLPGPRQDRRLKQAKKRGAASKALSPAPIAGNQHAPVIAVKGQGRSLRGGSIAY